MFTCTRWHKPRILQIAHKQSSESTSRQYSSSWSKHLDTNLFIASWVRRTCCATGREPTKHVLIQPWTEGMNRGTSSLNIAPFCSLFDYRQEYQNSQTGSPDLLFHSNSSHTLWPFLIFSGVSTKDNQLKPLIFMLKWLNSSSRVCQLQKKKNKKPKDK